MSLSKKKKPIPTVTQDKKKKIGFFSAIMLVIGSCVGAGVFFKARYILTNVHQDFVLSIVSWIIAAIAVIAMSLALIEVASVSLKSDKGIMEWNKVFNRRWIYYASKNFMTFLYMPITYFFMPVYACQSLLEAVHSFGVDVSSVPWWLILVISLITNIWFIIVSGLSVRAGNIQSWMINMVKFIPMIVAAVIGFVVLGINKGALPPGIVLPGSDTVPSRVPDAYRLQALSPSLGLFCSLSAIFFAYDGFYVASGIQSEMKEPKKTPIALVIGLSLVTVFYLLIAISSMIGSNSGDWNGFKDISNSEAWKICYGILSIFIAFGVFGIVNSYAIWTPRFMESLILDDEFFEFFAKYKHKVNLERPVLGIKISLILTIPIVVIFTVIGALGYLNIGGFDNSIAPEVAKLYSFADLSSSWTAVIVFGFIAFALFGCLTNRYTKKVKTNKTKLFIPCAIISLVLIAISLVLEVVNPFYSLVYVVNHKAELGSEYQTTLIGTILTIIVLFLYVAGMLLPIFSDFKHEKKLKLIRSWVEY